MSLGPWAQAVLADKAVLAAVMKTARNPERAEDAIQEALSRAVRNCAVL
jgi:hypothetical protein